MWYVNDVEVEIKEPYIINLDLIKVFVIEEVGKEIEVKAYGQIHDGRDLTEMYWVLYEGKEKEKAKKFLMEIGKALQSPKEVIYANEIYQKLKEKN